MYVVGLSIRIIFPLGHHVDGSYTFGRVFD